MCYAIKPAALPGIRIPADALPPDTAQGFYFAKDTVPVFLAGGALRLMRWDLIPRGFLRNEPATVTEAIRKKNSRAVNPATGKAYGFSSYNARIETVATLWTFKDAWREGNRGVIPVTGFRERPNMEEAPPEARGREYEISLEKPFYLAALYDAWVSKDRETLESCTVITGPSDEVPALQAIWHERVPILLNPEAARAWLDPALPSEAALALLRGAPVPALTVREIPKTPAAEKPAALRTPPRRDEPQLDLFGPA